MIEAIFFDQDDTLLDTKAVSTLAYRSAINYLADKMCGSREELWLDWQRVVGENKLSLDPSMRSLSFSLSKVCSNESWVDEAIAVLEKIVEDKIELNPGVRDFFEIPKKGIKYILATEDYANLLEIKLKKFALRDKFDLVIGNRETGIMKPSLEYYRIAWEKFELDPKKCVYVGDKYEKDCELGGGAGGTTVLFGSDDDKRADYRIDNFIKLREIIEKLDI